MIKDIIIVLSVLFMIIFAFIAFIISNTSDTITDNESVVVSTTEFQHPTEKRYMYVILGKIPPSNIIQFVNMESDVKLTYQQLKNKNPNFEIMSINVLDKKTGKF